jgi:hypothetical protein
MSLHTWFKTEEATAKVSPQLEPQVDLKKINYDPIICKMSIQTLQPAFLHLSDEAVDCSSIKSITTEHLLASYTDEQSLDVREPPVIETEVLPIQWSFYQDIMNL